MTADKIDFWESVDKKYKKKFFVLYKVYKFAIRILQCLVNIVQIVIPCQRPLSAV